MTLNRRILSILGTRAAQALNMAAAWGVIFGLFAVAVTGVAVIAGHATVTELGIVLILTGLMAVVCIVTESK
jgi:hypothetical protein